jgi:hypothetical protein
MLEVFPVIDDEKILFQPEDVCPKFAKWRKIAPFFAE